ncbi:DinB family protein [Fictibacillus sp. WQ 8-8]|uniref:DinB family protein n=1 Tax=Fictibacillus sp. WQ 8-8 TaxID=2938788 RepID=UPI00210A0574|nr:DinB family protein [Fictibacillus sp. WQ 8-8]MCQ6268617.1 DinB family protein [Fictibacillus sp. WQ 8-8]
MSQVLISTAKSVRQMVIRQIQSIPEDLFDVQPLEFSNTIRWNAGHIAVVSDSFRSLGLSFNSNLPKNYAELFKPGTKPSDWISKPPTKEELIENLSRQLSDISDIHPSTFEKQMDPPLELGPLRFKTFGEVFNFATIHETMHSTTISCQLKVLNFQKVN